MNSGRGGPRSSTVGDRDHAQGSVNALLRLWSTGIMSCPYCGSLPDREGRSEGSRPRLRFVFPQFPAERDASECVECSRGCEAQASKASSGRCTMRSSSIRPRLGAGSRRHAARRLDSIARQRTRVHTTPTVYGRTSRVGAERVNGTPTFPDGARYDDLGISGACSPRSRRH